MATNSKIGPLEVEPIHVDNTVPGAYGFIIYTSQGLLPIPAI
jgi:mRNA degradation ribonuclease J1/J2